MLQIGLLSAQACDTNGTILNRWYTPKMDLILDMVYSGATCFTIAISGPGLVGACTEAQSCMASTIEEAQHSGIGVSSSM